MPIQVLNNSQLCEFRNCPYKWGLHQVQKLVPRFTAIDQRFWGNLYHEGQKALWSWNGADLAARPELGLKAAFKAGKEMVDNTEHDLDMEVRDGAQEAKEALYLAWEEVQWALKNYAHNMEKELREWNVIAVEQTLRAIVSRGVHHQIKVDLVAYDPIHERIVIADHKSTSSPVDVYDGRLQLDTQHAGYTFVVRDLIRRGFWGDLEADWGLNFRGVNDCFQWHVVKRKVPGVPSINLLTKGDAKLPYQMEMLQEQAATGVHMGMVSVAKIDTLPQVYEAALMEQAEVRGLPISDKQRDLLASLKGKGDTFFCVTETFVPEDRIARWKADFLIDATRIRDAYRNVRLRTRNPSSCSLPMSPRCDYKDICIDPTATTGYVMDPSILDPMEDATPRSPMPRKQLENPWPLDRVKF